MLACQYSSTYLFWLHVCVVVVPDQATMPKRKDYDQKALESAMTDIQNGGLSKKSAAKKYGVTRATIQFRLSTKFVKSSCGPSIVLTSEEESLLEDWITKIM